MQPSGQRTLPNGLNRRGVGTMGTGGYIVPPKFRTCTPRTRQIKDAAYVKILSKCEFNYKIV